MAVMFENIRDVISLRPAGIPIHRCLSANKLATACYSGPLRASGFSLPSFMFCINIFFSTTSYNARRFLQMYYRYFSEGKFSYTICVLWRRTYRYTTRSLLGHGMLRRLRDINSRRTWRMHPSFVVVTTKEGCICERGVFLALPS